MKTKIIPFTYFKMLEPDKTELWLEEMSKKGWHLVSFNFMWFKFKKGEPTSYSFCFDSRFKFDSDYFKTFKDFGWEFVGYTSELYIWKKQYSEMRPEAFSDKENIKNRTTMVTISAVFKYFLIVLLFAAPIEVESLIRGFGVHINYSDRLMFVGVGWLLEVFVVMFLNKINANKLKAALKSTMPEGCPKNT